jgi:hypothetical protein
MTICLQTADMYQTKCNNHIINKLKTSKKLRGQTVTTMWVKSTYEENKRHSKILPVIWGYVFWMENAYEGINISL